MDFKELMNSREYDFLRENPRLGRRIILLGLGGSYAYGTDNENSDIHFRLVKTRRNNMMNNIMVKYCSPIRRGWE